MSTTVITRTVAQTHMCPHRCRKCPKARRLRHVYATQTSQRCPERVIHTDYRMDKHQVLFRDRETHSKKTCRDPLSLVLLSTRTTAQQQCVFMGPQHYIRHPLQASFCPCIFIRETVKYDTLTKKLTHTNTCTRILKQISQLNAHKAHRYPSKRLRI